VVGRGELTDRAWAQLAPLLPRNQHRGGRWRDHRRVINGILWKLRGIGDLHRGRALQAPQQRGPAGRGRQVAGEELGERHGLLRDADVYVGVNGHPLPVHVWAAAVLLVEDRTAPVRLPTVMATVDREQLAALRMLRQRFGHVQVLALVERRGVEGEAARLPPHWPTSRSP
jgi:Putative transposase of IS4/5 family (DUF4096)